MRKNVKSEKVIRAMAIGISAMLMASSPLTTLAAEPGEGIEPEKKSSEGEEAQESHVCDKAQEAADNASEAITVGTEENVGAIEGVDTVTKSILDESEETHVVAGEVVDKDGKDLAQDVIDKAEAIDEKNDAGSNTLTDLVAADNTDIQNTKDQLDTAEKNDGLYNGALDKATDAATDAADIDDKMEESMAAMEEANAKVDEKLDDIKNATTITDANDAYAELEETANQVQEEFNEKLNAYNEAKAEYDDAVEKMKEYESAYNTAIANADVNAEEAAKKLKDAQEKAAALEEAVAAAEKAVDSTATGAIAAAEKVCKEDNGLNWRNEDKLFIAIMENYYLPEKLGIENATVTRIQGLDNNEYNYFTAEYTDENGEKQIKYYNFKMDNGSKDDIVIFEKRIEEVEYEEYQNTNPDQYVDKDGNVIDTAAGLEGGTVVKVDGKYVEKNDMTDSETLVSNSEITKTSTTDVTVDEGTKQESWSLDKEGNLVKTVTADVTTITYAGAQFDASKAGLSYATDADRDKAAEAKEKELEEATGKDATVTETEKTTYTYTASGTYIPTFTKTVDVNKEYESGYLWYEADSKKEAKDKALDWAKDEIDDDLGDYYLVGDIKSDLSVTMTEEETETYKIFGKKHTIVTDDADYLVTGTVTATYAKVTKKTVSQSTFGSLWDDIQVLIKGGQSTNEKLEETARKAVEAEGGIFVSADWADWKFNKATIRYVAGVKVTTGEEETKQVAEGAVEAAAREQAIANGATGVYNVKTTGTNTIDHTTYSYTVDYLEKASEKTENKTVETETYGNAEALTGEIIQNKNYLDENYLLVQKTDKEYNEFMETARKLTYKYDQLLAEAKAAKDAAKTAQEEVDNLKAAIAELQEKNSETDLTGLKAKLAEAEKKKEEAEKKNNEIQQKLKDAENERNAAIARLTPAPTGGEGTDDTTDDTETTVTTPVVLATVPAATVNVVAPAPVAQPEVVEIEEEVTPLAPAVEENKQEETKAEPESQETIQLDDEETPLADIIVEDEQTKMSWWWLLIVALLGATGYEMYKKHNEKKALAENAEQDAE